MERSTVLVGAVAASLVANLVLVPPVVLLLVGGPPATTIAHTLHLASRRQAVSA